MALMDDAIQSVAKFAGWKAPQADSAGVFHFSLQGDLDFAMFSPDGRTCITRGTVCTLPAEGSDRDDTLRDMARRQVGACRVRSSVLCLEKPGAGPIAGVSGREEGPKLVLFRQTHLTADNAALVADLRDFLNDLAWWKASRNGSQTSAAPFTGGFSMPGVMGFMGDLR